ncbi:hypothetical protein N0V90_005881 [Kalmusia sp. IMI 367209]|nr:hypothetical protein N0V90_005881 [Kalmusia sp. IMI 367209]
MALWTAKKSPLEDGKLENAWKALGRMLFTINDTIKLEPRSVKDIIGKPNLLDIVTLWSSFIYQHLSKFWVRKHIGGTLKQAKVFMKENDKLLEERETADDKRDNKYTLAQRNKQKPLAAMLKTQKADITPKRKALLMLQMTKAQKDAHKDKIIEATNDLFEAQRKQRLTHREMREMHELYSYSIKMIIKNLRKDQQRLLAYQKAILDPEMARP